MAAGISATDPIDYSTYSEELLAFARQLCVSYRTGSRDALADDLCQTVLMRAHDSGDPLNRHLRGIRSPAAVRSYLKRTLYHEYIDFMRAEKKRGESLSEDSERITGSDVTFPWDTGIDHESIRKKICQYFCTIRLMLDRMDAGWPESRTVNYYSVFIFALRKSVLRMLIRSVRDSGRAWSNSTVKRLAEYLIHWTGREESMKFIASCPVIRDIWRPFANQAARCSDVTDIAIVRIVNEYPGNETPLEFNTYQQWNLRSKKIASSLLTEADWTHFFEHLFRSRHGGS